MFQSTVKSSGVPSLNDPSLWYYEPKDILYTGFTCYNSNIVNQLFHPLSLWSFKPDGAGSGPWDQVIGSNCSVWEPLTRTAASLMAYSPNTALAFGGDRGFYEPISSQTLVSSVVQSDMGSQSFANRSAQCCNATGGIERSAMQYVPSFGPKGLFIAMGGLNGLTYNTTDGLIEMSEVEPNNEWKSAQSKDVLLHRRHQLNKRHL